MTTYGPSLPAHGRQAWEMRVILASMILFVNDQYSSIFNDAVLDFQCDWEESVLFKSDSLHGLP